MGWIMMMSGWLSMVMFKLQEASELLDDMKDKPRLRTYAPILSAYYSQGKVQESFDMYERILRDGIEVTEAEYINLVRLCTDQDHHKGFQRVMEDMKQAILEVSEGGLEHILAYFEKQGKEAYAITPKVSVQPSGKCLTCGEVLRSIDIQPDELEGLMSKITQLVLEDARRKIKWDQLQEWASRHERDYEVVIDGANVGFYEMNYVQDLRHINYQQVGRDQLSYLLT